MGSGLVRAARTVSVLRASCSVLLCPLPLPLWLRTRSSRPNLCSQNPQRSRSVPVLTIQVNNLSLSRQLRRDWLRPRSPETLTRRQSSQLSHAGVQRACVRQYGRACQRGRGIKKEKKMHRIKQRVLNFRCQYGNEICRFHRSFVIKRESHCFRWVPFE